MYFFVFIIGSIIGSFLLCSVDRYHTPILSRNSRSVCSACQHKLAFWHLIPLFSYIILKGHCFYCQRKLPFYLFCAELFASINLVVLYIHHSCLSISDIFIYLIIYLILLLMSFFDYLYLYVPDFLQFCFLIIGILYNHINGTTYWSHFFMCASLSLVLLFLDNPWIGGADIKFICISLLYLPLIKFPEFIFMASSLAILFIFSSLHNNKNRQIPFIPFLCFSLIYYI
ncbi:prepilin peptidase [Facklamia sp. DSM 111018]|uniref:Prepilin peptidase n=1 Tax=Facklamia lactis TaxID=2749967 RepID=A0ABS0LSX8_9LACT|nr:prepilin peptidase [Facklamia lactis]MBG9987262.1 prepilin peptidase [Facklamia lactis]